VSSGFYFGEHGYFGKAEWTNGAWATVTEGTVVPSWLPDSWLHTVGWSPLYQELTRVPLIVHAPGLVPGRREALTSAPNLTPTILEPTGVGPSAMQGESFLDVLVGSEDEHRPFVVSSWPLYFAAGEIITAVDSRPRRLSS
jgi:arylsulfatase A-like enzyme